MSTENIPSENLDAPKPVPVQPAEPPGRTTENIKDDLLSLARELDRNMNWQDREHLNDRRIELEYELRQLTKARQAKESAESTARAKAVTDEVIKRGDRALTAEEAASEAEAETEAKRVEPGFELEVSELLPPDLKEEAGRYAEDLAAIGTDVGIGQTEMQVVFDTAVDIAVTLMPSGDVVNLANESECRAVMDHRWGTDAAKEIIADANKAVSRLGPDVKAWLNQVHEDGSQIGNSPATVYALAAWQRGWTGMTALKAAGEVARLRETPEYQRGDKAVTDKVAVLMKVSTKFSKNEHKSLWPDEPKPAPSPQETGRRKVEEDIAKIRSHPDYTSIDSKKRAPLVAAMRALQAQIHGNG